MACDSTSTGAPDAAADVAEDVAEDVAVDAVADTAANDRADTATDAATEDLSTDVVSADARDAPATDLGGTTMWRDPYGLLTLNLHCLRSDGTTFRTNEERFGAIAAAVAAERVKVIAVQEACRRDSTSAIAMLEGALSTATGARWASTWTAAHTAWEGTPDEALEGLGVLVQGALDPASVHVHRYRTQSGLTRVMVGARLPPELGGAALYSVHLSYESPAARAEQARETASVALSATHPSPAVLIAGDFNAVPGSPSHRALSQWGYRDLTASLPADRIDHIWASAGAGLSSDGATVIFDGARHPVVSDHHGYLVRVSPAAAPAVTLTTLLATADVGDGHALTVRGDGAPLGWDQGWTAWRASSNTWRLVCPTLPSRRFEYKWLVDDTRWQTGPNAAGVGGTESAITPVF